MRHPFVDMLVDKRERGERVPLLDERPQLDEFQAFYFQAFSVLNSCRGSIAQGVGPIPWLSVMQYCDERDITDAHERAEMWTHMSAMDSVFTKHVQQQIKDSVAEARRRG